MLLEDNIHSNDSGEMPCGSRDPCPLDSLSDPSGRVGTAHNMGWRPAGVSVTTNLPNHLLVIPCASSNPGIANAHGGTNPGKKKYV